MIEHANGFATFAANGMYTARPHLIKTITERPGQVLYDFRQTAPRRPAAFSEDAARDAGFAMQEVVKGTSQGAAHGRPPGRGQDRNAGHQRHLRHQRQLQRVDVRLHAAARRRGVAGASEERLRAIKFANDRRTSARRTPQGSGRTSWTRPSRASRRRSCPEPVFAGDENKGEMLAPRRAAAAVAGPGWPTRGAAARPDPGPERPARRHPGPPERSEHSGPATDERQGRRTTTSNGRAGNNG